RMLPRTRSKIACTSSGCVAMYSSTDLKLVLAISSLIPGCDPTRHHSFELACAAMAMGDQNEFGGQSRFGLGRGSLEGDEQGLDVVRVVVPRAVDVERRRAVDATPHAAQEVLVDPRGVDVLGQLLVEELEVEPELLG